MPSSMPDEKERTVFVRSLRYERVDGAKPRFFIEDIEESRLAASSMMEKYLWQSQTFHLIVINEVVSGPATESESQLRKRNRVQRRIVRRARQENEPHEFYVTDIVRTEGGSCCQAEKEVRESIWSRKDVNISERYILLRQFKNLNSFIARSASGSNGNNAKLRVQEQIPSQALSSYGPLYDAFDRPFYPLDGSVSSEGERPVGALGRISYKCEKLLHVAVTEAKPPDEKLYGVRPVSLRVQYMPAVIWVDAGDGVYRMSTSHFKVFERVGNSVETKLLRVWSTGLASSSAKSSLSYEKEVSYLKSERLGEHNDFVPNDAVVIELGSPPSLKRERSAKPKEALPSLTAPKVILEEASDSDFEDLGDASTLGDLRAYAKPFIHRPSPNGVGKFSQGQSDDPVLPSNERPSNLFSRPVQSIPGKPQINLGKSVSFSGAGTDGFQSGLQSREGGQGKQDGEKRSHDSFVAKLGKDDGQTLPPQTLPNQNENEYLNHHQQENGSTSGNLPNHDSSDSTTEPSGKHFSRNLGISAIVSSDLCGEEIDKDFDSSVGFPSIHINNTSDRDEHTNDEYRPGTSEFLNQRNDSSVSDVERDFCRLPSPLSDLAVDKVQAPNFDSRNSHRRVDDPTVDTGTRLDGEHKNSSTDAAGNEEIVENNMEVDPAVKEIEKITYRTMVARTKATVQHGHLDVIHFGREVGEISMARSSISNGVDTSEVGESLLPPIRQSETLAKPVVLPVNDPESSTRISPDLASINESKEMSKAAEATLSNDSKARTFVAGIPSLDTTTFSAGKGTMNDWTHPSGEEDYVQSDTRSKATPCDTFRPVAEASPSPGTGTDVGESVEPLDLQGSFDEIRLAVIRSYDSDELSANAAYISLRNYSGPTGSSENSPVKAKDYSLPSVHEETSKELEFVRRERHKLKDSGLAVSQIPYDVDDLRHVGKVSVQDE